MKEKVLRLAYLVRCFNHLGGLILSVRTSPRMNATQVEQLRRWKRVRRALALDIQQVQQEIGNGAQLTWECTNEDSEAAWQWCVRLRDSFAEQYKLSPPPQSAGNRQHHTQGG